MLDRCWDWVLVPLQCPPPSLGGSSFGCSPWGMGLGVSCKLWSSRRSSTDEGVYLRLRSTVAQGDVRNDKEAYVMFVTCKTRCTRAKLKVLLAIKSLLLTTMSQQEEIKSCKDHLTNK